MKVLGWRFYIDGGFVFDSRNNNWNEVSSDGVIIGYLYKEQGYKEEMCGSDRYFQAPHSEGIIYGHSNDSEQEIKKRYPGAVVKRGKWVPPEVFSRIQKEAVEYQWQHLVT